MSEPPISDGLIYKTMVNDGTSIFPVDTIEYQGKFWLILRWIYPPSKEWREPQRLICISNLPHQDLRQRQQRPADFSVLLPLPKVLFEAIPQPKRCFNDKRSWDPSRSAKLINLQDMENVGQSYSRSLRLFAETRRTCNSAVSMA
jgi:hypothetical protein